MRITRASKLSRLSHAKQKDKSSDKAFTRECNSLVRVADCTRKGNSARLGSIPNTPAMIEIIIVLINLYRQADSLKPLKVSPYLTRVAEQRCITLKEWSHTGFQETAQPILDKGFSIVGENLAIMNMAGQTPITVGQNTVRLWEASPTHRSNNHGDFTHIGVANCLNQTFKATTTVAIFAKKK